jgi:predicted DCC family thiol-disulfide oxidoreductase YuxK
VHDSQKIILFDGVCGLCNAWVDFILKRDRNKVFKFAPLQGDFAQGVCPDASKQLHSVVYITGEKKYYRSGAALRILRDLGGAWSLFFIFWLLPFFIREFFYTLIARFRYQIFGKAESCRLPLPEERDRFLD